MTTSWALPPQLTDATRVAVLEATNARSGVLRRNELTALGVTTRQIDQCLESRRWQQIHNVIVLHNTQLTPTQQLSVATSVGVELVALAARTAAAAAGLTGWPAPALEVLVRKGATYPTLPFSVRVHESRRFKARDICPGWPPRVSIERALVDAGAWSARPKVAIGLLASGVQQRLTTPDRLTAALADAGQVRFRRLMAAALLDIGGGAQAVSEIAFLRWCRRHDLPEPVLQQVRRDSSGRRRYMDATFRRSDGSLIRVEVDGALHFVVLSYWDDMSRGNELTIDGEQVLRFPTYAIYADDPAAIAQLRRALDLSVPPHTSAA